MDEALLQDVVSAALRAGADAAEAVFAERASLSVTVRLGALEEVEREEARDLGLRVFVGRRQARVSGSDVSAEGRAKLIDRVVAMARLAAEDPWAGLAPADRLANGARLDLHLFDPTEPAPETLEASAKAAEDAARAVPGVTNSGGASASWSASTWRMVTSGGFAGRHRASAFSLSAEAIAGDGSGMEQGAEWRATRWADDLPAPASIGAEAGRRAVASLGARKIASTTAPVIFENRLASSLLGPADRGHFRAVGGARRIVPEGPPGRPPVRRRRDLDRRSPSRPRSRLLALRRRGRGQPAHGHHRRRRPHHLAAERQLGPPAGPGDHRPRLARPRRPARRRTQQPDPSRRARWTGRR